MGIGILAPVPATILMSTEKTCTEAGRVAFGSNAWELFNKATRQFGKGLRVYPTHHYGEGSALADVSSEGAVATTSGSPAMTMTGHTTRPK